MRRSRALGAIALIAVVLAADPGTSRAAPRVDWSARERIDWFKSRYSCFPGAAVEVALGRAFIATTVATDERHSDILVSARRLSDGSRLWRRRLDVGRVEGSEDIAVGANGTVFVLGTQGELNRRGAPRGMLVFALSEEDGRLVWWRRVSGPEGRAEAVSLALSPDGASVFIVGNAYPSASTASDSAPRALVAALDAEDGRVVWAVTPSNSDGGRDHTYGCEETPTSRIDATSDAVLVALAGQIDETDEDVMTTAVLDAGTGEVRWWWRLRGWGHGSVAATPDGTTAVFAGGWDDAVVAAYDLATGERVWRRRFRGYPTIASLVLAPDHGRLFVAGGALGPRVWTASLRLADGGLRWQRRYRDLDHRHDATGIAVSPDESRVYVSTWACTQTVDDPHDDLPLCLRDYAVLRYSADDGRGGLWATHSGPYRWGWEIAEDIDVSARGRVVVTGISQSARASNTCGRYVCHHHYDVVTVAFAASVR